MKYRHYAPKAELTIFKGNAGNVAAAINAAAKQAEETGKKARILCADANAHFYPAHLARPMGSDAAGEMIAHELYRALRECDEQAVDVIFSESFDDNPLSEAIMNRLMKAAGYRVTEV